MDEKKETIKALDRYLSPLDVWAMAFGVMVGWGAFAMPGNAFREDVQAAMDAGMQAHIAKPIDIGVLTQTLRSVLRS